MTNTAQLPAAARAPRLTSFQRWFKTFIEEKGIDADAGITVEGPSGANFMTAQTVIDAIMKAPAHEQAGIKSMLVRIDFANAPVMPYFVHLAKALAI